MEIERGAKLIEQMMLLGEKVGYRRLIAYNMGLEEYYFVSK